MPVDWQQVTPSSRTMRGFYTGKVKPVVNIEAKKAEILTELEKLVSKLPGVND